MTIIYPINGKNERMGSLFNTPKHLLLYKGKEIIRQSIETIQETFKDCKVIILTNEGYYNSLNSIFTNIQNVEIKLISKTNSQVETLKTVTSTIEGPVMFIDCDIVPEKIIDFDKNNITIFTFENNAKLLNYSNFKIRKDKSIIECNEKQKFYKNAGAGIYYFPNVEFFNASSENCKSISECVNILLKSKIKAFANTNSEIVRLGTLQDIYIDNFSFRKPKTKDLSTGFTTNKVIKNYNKVIKIGETTQSEKEWYYSYKNKKHIPKVISHEGNKLTLEYIKRDADINLNDILELIDEYKTYDKLNLLDFKSYIENIKKHLLQNSLINNGNKLVDCLNNLNINPTFCHGDLSVMNIIPTKLGLKLIDPLYSNIKFGSYELDLAKLCFSFKFYKNDSASYSYIKNKANIEYLDILIAAESVRVASYKNQYSFIAENLINELN